MAEPKTLEEAIVAYEENRFSRKSLLRFMVDRQLATETAVAALRGQVSDLLVALMQGRQNGAVEPPQERAAPAAEWMESLRVQAEEVGLKVDKRWSEATLFQKIRAARVAYVAGAGAEALADGRRGGDQ